MAYEYNGNLPLEKFLQVVACIVVTHCLMRVIYVGAGPTSIAPLPVTTQEDSEPVEVLEAANTGITALEVITGGGLLVLILACWQCYKEYQANRLQKARDRENQDPFVQVLASSDVLNIDTHRTPGEREVLREIAKQFGSALMARANENEIDVYGLNMAEMKSLLGQKRYALRNLLSSCGFLRQGGAVYYIDKRVRVDDQVIRRMARRIPRQWMTQLVQNYREAKDQTVLDIGFDPNLDVSSDSSDDDSQPLLSSANSGAAPSTATSRSRLGSGASHASRSSTDSQSSQSKAGAPSGNSNGQAQVKAGT